MEALELRYIVLGYEYFQLVSFDIQNGFTIHGGIFFLVPVICVGSSLCAIFSLNIPELLKKKHTEIWKFPRFLQVFLSK